MNTNIDLAKASTTLLSAPSIYKPFHYPWAYEAWLLQQKLHWLPEDISLADDVKDWQGKLTEGERNLLTQIFRFFTQSDIEVNNCYMRKYAGVFQPTEVIMMLAAFANMETIHVAAYAYLLDTIGMPELEYSAFMKYKEMKDKYDYMQQWSMKTPRQMATTMAVFGAFTEGLQLFASFVMLMNFPRFNKMKGMGQIVTYSVRDESLHTECIIRLHNTFLEENPEVRDKEYENTLLEICKSIVKHEDAFIDLAFEMGSVQGLTAEDVKKYIRYIADRRLQQLHLKPYFGVDKNPLPWMDEMMNGVEFSNFFENRSTEYAKGATTGTWEEAFDAILDKKPNAPQLIRNAPRAGVRA